MKAELIKPEGEIELIAPKNNGWFTLEELQKLVGGYIERVKLSTGKVMIVDEDGMLKGLPFNPRGTELYKLGRENYAEDLERMSKRAVRAGFSVHVLGNPKELRIVGTVIVCDKSMLIL